MLCENCKTEIPNDSLFCPNCGSILKEEGTAHSNSDQINCPYCGTSLPQDSVFCTHCGKKIEQAIESSNIINSNEMRCLDCGAIIPKDSVFCPLCGSACVDGNQSTDTEKDNNTLSDGNILFYNQDVFIQNNTPVYVKNAWIVSNKNTDELFARITFENISDYVVNAIMVSIDCVSIWDESLNTVQGVQYLDLHAGKGETFGTEKLIPLPNKETRRIQIVINRVSTENGNVINCEIEKECYGSAESLEEYFGNNNLADEFRNRCCRTATVVPVFYRTSWRCACGTINLSSELICRRCKTDKNTLAKWINRDFINQQYEERIRILAEQREKELIRRREEERARLEKAAALAAEQEKRRIAAEAEEAERKRIAEEKRAIRKQALRKRLKLCAIALGSIAACALLVYLIGWIIIPNAQYNKAVSLMKKKQYEDAAQLFSKSGIKDSTELSQECSWAAVYANAEELLSEGKIIEAAEAFASISGYLDSSERSKKTLYDYGTKLIDSGDYFEAHEILIHLHYKDSKDLANKAIILKAKQYLDEEKYEDALETIRQHITNYLQYEDSKEIGLEALYWIAKKSYDAGDYANAFEQFGEIAYTYKDSKELFNESGYLLAVQLMEAKKYGNARKILDRISEYKDSSTLSQEATYLEACEYAEKSKYVGAIALFSSISTYKDSNSKLNDLRYTYAGKLASEKQYKEALTQYELLGSYKDSKALFQQTKYDQATEYLNGKEYDKAISVFEELGSYKDSKTIVQQIKYDQATQYLNNKSFAKAISIFSELGTYKDSKKMVQESKYRYGLYFMDQKKYTSAVETFGGIKNYSDSAAKRKDAMWAYVKQFSNNNDINTYKYLTELKKSGYKGAKEKYNNLYAWKVELVYVNSSKNDYTTKASSVSRYTSYLQFGFRLIGGPPGEKITLYHRVKWPDGHSSRTKWYWEDVSRFSTFSCYWEDGPFSGKYRSNAKSGKITIQVYNKATGELLGEGSIRLT